MDANELEILVSNQRRELMAASEAESDLDLAFHLQLQEAMAASLALPAPSSSTAAATASSSTASSSSSAPPPPLDPDVDVAANVIGLQTLELDRFEQESRDSERCLEEMRRATEDLRRQAHDAKFAREIMGISDDEWEEYGDNIEKPIDQGFEEEEEPFRLYFKGLCESLPGSANECLSAVGVAICNPQGKVVLKIQKPMPGPKVCREIMETRALIEGLDAVLSLGIRSLDIYFHHTVLFNHITRKWAVKQHKVADIINQALVLQRKVKKSRIFLLPRCDMQFVFKLAKDAIDSQLRKSVEGKDNKNLMEICNICLEDTAASQMFEVDGCLHHFCFSCMKQHVEVKLLYGILPGCPHEGCKTRLNEESSKKFLTPKLTEIMAQRLREASIPTAEKVYCPYPKCSALMSRSEVRCPDESGSGQCSQCGGLFCIKCKVPWHAKMSCHDYKRYNPYPRAEDAKLHSLANRNLWRQCVKCNHMIELASGCFHMTCRCGFEFCYTCGAEWKNKKATCSCPLWQEDYILDEDENAAAGDFYDNDEDYEDDYDSDSDYGHY